MDIFVILACLIGVAIGLVIALMIYGKKEETTLAPSFSLETLDLLNGIVKSKSKQDSIEALQWLNIISEKSYELHCKAGNEKRQMEERLGI